MRVVCFHIYSWCVVFLLIVGLVPADLTVGRAHTYE